MQKLARKARQGGYALITTRKDYVKIPPDYDIQFLDIKLDFENESEITALFLAHL
jgi:tetraacyldisaccharide-1-P 4'-kinase